jgi:uncharacterized membrane protein HdeD (DUF308 family)
VGGRHTRCPWYLFGLVALFLPGATMLSLVLIFAAYAFIDGVFGIISAVRAAGRHERWVSLVLEGVVDIIVAAIAVLWPGITVVAFVLLVAAWAIVTGGLMLWAAFRLDTDRQDDRAQGPREIYQKSGGR